MKKILPLLLLLLAISASAQRSNFLSTRVLIPCVDITRYAEFLGKFGFHSSPQASMPKEAHTELLRLTDGQIFLTLMRAEFKGIHLAMFTDHIDDYAASIPKDRIANIERSSGHSIDEIDISAADGVGIYMHPSPTMIPVDSTINEQLGAFAEFSIGVKNIESELPFWKSLGYTLVSKESTPTPSAKVSDGEFTVGLHNDPNFSGTAITYAAKNVAMKVALLKANGIEPIVTLQNKKGETIGASYQAPEGLIINVHQVQ